VTWKHYSLEQSAARFDSSQDLTIGIEEEFQILDAESLDLTSRFEELHAVARDRLGTNVRGELIASEVEVCTAKCNNLAEAEADLKDKRQGLLESAAETGLALGAFGTHPFSNWKDQRILNTPHYRAVEEQLKYCAWRNLTYGMHTHIGVRGHERMIHIYNALRGFMPHLLALSANSPFAEGRYTYLHSVRAQIFTRSFPRCNIPGAFRDWQEYADLIDMYFATNSITEPTQVWWSLRPHPLLGTVEVRICDCQAEVSETLAVAALAIALVAKLGEEHDNGKQLPVLDSNQLDENIWRATRYGLDGNLIDFQTGTEIPTPEAILELIDYTGDVHKRLGLVDYISHIPLFMSKGNGAQKQIRVFEQTGDIAAVNADAVSRSRFDYAFTESSER
jgi:carboxylate-amine ligase